MLIPISFMGIEISQTMGQTTKASTASGQHRTNRMYQLTRKNSAFTGL
jgi:hypothetical protein